MAAQDKTKHYWMKVYSRFMDKHEIKILLDEDRDYVFFYFAMLLESIPHKGYVRYNEKKAYTPDKLARLLNMPEDKVVKSIEALKDADLLEMLEDGTIYLPNAPAMCGFDTGLAIRLRGSRDGKDEEVGSNGFKAGSNEPDVGSNEPNAGSNEPDMNPKGVQSGFKTGSNEPKVQSTKYKVQSTEYKVQNRESVCNARARKCHSWEEVKTYITGPNVSIRIPEVFAKEWYDEMVFADWVDAKGQDMSEGWKRKLYYAWKDKQKEMSKKGGGGIVTNYITFRGKIYTPTQTEKGLRYVIPYMMKDRWLPLTTTDETVEKVLEDIAAGDWD